MHSNSSVCAPRAAADVHVDRDTTSSPYPMRMRHAHQLIIIAAVVAWFGVALPVHAQEMDVAPVRDPESWRGVVREVIRSEERVSPRTGARERNGTFAVELLEGPQVGKRVTVEYDLLPLKSGTRVFIVHLVGPDGGDTYALEDVDRRIPIAVVVGLFAVVVFIFGRGQGIRSLAVLAASLIALVTVLLPAILRGAPPAWTSALFAIVVLAVAIPLTHGWNRTTCAAVLGTVGAIIGIVVLADLAVRAASLTGLVEEVSLYLDIEHGGRLDLRGLLLGAMLIGVLGVLDDVAVTQAATVEEIASAAPNLSVRDVRQRALRVGREHVGALVNTLALAYAGAALPILLLLAGSSVPITRILNRELFAAEIIRTAVGSIGIIMAVPLTTWIAARLLVRRSEQVPAKV